LRPQYAPPPMPGDVQHKVEGESDDEQEPDEVEVKESLVSKLSFGVFGGRYVCVCCDVLC